MNNGHPTPSSALMRHLIIPLVASVPNFDKLAKKGEEHWCVENPLKLSFWLGCLLSLMDSQGKFDSSTQCGHCQKIPREKSWCCWSLSLNDFLFLARRPTHRSPSLLTNSGNFPICSRRRVTGITNFAAWFQHGFRLKCWWSGPAQLL